MNNTILKFVNKFKQYFEPISFECILLSIYVVSLPFTIIETPFGSLLTVITVPIVACMAYKLLFGKSKMLAFNSVHLTYTLYILYTIGGMLLLSNSSSFVTTKDMVLAYATTIMITMRVYNNKERNFIENAWIIVGLFSIYLGNFQTKEMEGEGRIYVYINGNYEDPNQFCAYFFMPTMICIKRIIQKSKLMPLYITLVVLMLYTILLGGSRGGLIGLVAGIVIYVMLGIKNVKTKLAIVAVGLVCTILVVGVIFPLLPQELRDRYSISRVQEDKGSGRFEIWSYLISYTAEKPERIIRGSGVVSTIVILENATVNEIARVAHNQFVQVFADQGIIGMLLYLIWIAACFFRNIKKNPEYACAFAACMAISMSLTVYTFKPITNIVIMCAITYNDICSVEQYNEMRKKRIPNADQIEEAQ